jgi:GNAT superfamily N-acetyltransferase
MTHTAGRRKELESIMQGPETQSEWGDIEVRLAKADDAPAIETVLSQSFEEYKERYTSAAFKAATPPQEIILKRMEEGPTWVAEQRGEIVGTISAIPHGRTLVLRAMAVPPEERGRALGKLLLVSVARYAFRNRYRRMTISASPFLTRALREYEQFGFQRSKEGPSEFHGTPVYNMTKTL